jgi:O-methyltransferase
MLARIAQRFRIRKEETWLRETFRKYRDFTMIPEEIFIDNLRLASTIKNISGEIVECGTWRGGMIAGIADVLGAGRHYHLFDSFEGLPPAREIDGAAALAWQRNTSGPVYHNNCRASEDEARHAMSMSAARNYTLVKGWFDETLPRANVGPIALLRMDADWYDSTKAILENIAPSVVPGGLIVIDDYYTWDGCTRAVNESATQRNWMIRQYSRTGVCHIIV